MIPAVLKGLLPATPLNWIVFAVGAFTALVAIALLLLWLEVSKPPPRRGTPYKLPNGMQIQHWQKSETDFLYEEIWGSESAYAGEDKITFTPGATILDAGANIGMFSMYAAYRCKGDATIYSFEPIPTTFEVLRANAEAANAGRFDAVFKPAAGSKTKINAMNVGLSQTSCDARFEHHPHFSVWSTQDAKFAVARLERIAADVPRAAAGSSNPLVRMIPSAMVSWVGRRLLSKLGKMEHVDVKLVPLSKVIADERISRIDILKVDVEGAEMAVLEGLTPADWAKVQQVVLEVENFATKDAICALLHGKGFATDWVPSERERTPGVQSEVCMVYASRTGLRSKAAGAAAGAAGAAGAAAAAKPAAAAPAAAEEDHDAADAAPPSSGIKKRTTRKQQA